MAKFSDKHQKFSFEIRFFTTVHLLQQEHLWRQWLYTDLLKLIRISSMEKTLHFPYCLFLKLGCGVGKWERGGAEKGINNS